MAHLQEIAPPLLPPTLSPAHVNIPGRNPAEQANTHALPAAFKNGHMDLATFSPVNQNGSFEFDRVLKSGKVLRRVKNKGAWKPSWKPAYLVLRPNLLSIYKSPDETGLRASITLTDVTAVAQVKKTKIDNVFGVFCPAKNYYFQCTSQRDTQDWIQQVRVESCADLVDEYNLPSPGVPQVVPETTGYDSTSGEEDAGGPETQERHRSRAKTAQRRMSHLNEYSGNEMMTSHSDFSDAAGSLPKAMAHSIPRPWTLTPIPSGQPIRPNMARNASQMSGFDGSNDPERVIRHGWLQCLKTKRGVKSWKNLWIVLRVKMLSFYKDEDEYSAVKVVSMSSVINAAEIDPVSKSKKFCFQIIIEDKTFRLCAPDEEELARWLGALKSVLAKRKETSAALSENLGALKLSQKAPGKR